MTELIHATVLRRIVTDSEVERATSPRAWTIPPAGTYLLSCDSNVANTPQRDAIDVRAEHLQPNLGRGDASQALQDQGGGSHSGAGDGVLVGVQHLPRDEGEASEARDQDQPPEPGSPPPENP